MLANSERWEPMRHRIDRDVTESENQGPSVLHAPIGEDEVSINGLVDIILEVGTKRNALIVRMRRALETDDTKQLKILARQLCGLSNEDNRGMQARVN